jgi:hypothetical protein
MEYVNAHKPVDTPKKKSAAVILLGVVCVLLVVACMVAFVYANNGKYQEAAALAASAQTDADFYKARRVANLVLPTNPNARELKNFINAGILVGEGGYTKANELLQTLGGLFDASELQKNCDFHIAQQLYAAEDYEAAEALFLPLGAYNEADKWRAECSYRIGLGYYYQLAQASEQAEICQYGALAIEKFSGLPYHEYAPAMLIQTSDYLYGIGVSIFEGASESYNMAEPLPDITEEAAETDTGGDTNDDTAGLTEEEAPASPETIEAFDPLEETYMVMFQDALQYFSAVPAFKDSAKYIEIISALSLPADAAAAVLREQVWDFAPARKFILGKYLPYFFYGRWSGGGFGVVFDETYQFYVMAQESGSSYGNGSIMMNTKKGRTLAYSFSVTDAGAIDIIGAKNSKTYSLARVAALPDGVEPITE